MAEVTLEGLRVEDGWLVGPERVPMNRGTSEWLAKHGYSGLRGGNIHDDATAQRLGFRGGTVAGSVHLDQFPPVLVGVFGLRWFARGSISLGFRNATVDAEPVIAMVRLAEDGATQVAARMERPDGLVVAEGTAGCDEHEQPFLHATDLRAGADGLRLLAGVEAGAPLTRRSARVESAEQRARLEGSALTEPLDLYLSGSPWGPPVVPPSAAVQLLRNGAGDFGEAVANAVGLFGAIELAFPDGPLLCDRAYEVEGEVVAVGASPKTEYVWYDSRARDEDGRVAASMRMQLRWMKASSPLYQDEQP
jgi:hypothetical protein